MNKIAAKDCAVFVPKSYHVEKHQHINAALVRKFGRVGSAGSGRFGALKSMKASQHSSHLDRQVKLGTPRTLYNEKCKEQARLTFEMIMSMDSTRITRIKDAFMCRPGNSITLPEFLMIMQENCPPKPHISLETYTSALVDLFQSMDLDGNLDLEFSEYLACIIHLGMSAAEQYGVSPVRQYAKGPSVRLSAKPCDHLVSYISSLDRLITYDPEKRKVLFYHPSNVSKPKNRVNVGHSDILAFEYIEKDERGMSFDMLATARTSCVTLWTGARDDDLKKSHHIVTRTPQSALGWDPYSSLLYCGSNAGELTAYNLSNQKTLPNVFMGHVEMVTSIRPVTGMESIASGSLDRLVKLWDVHTGSLVRTFSSHKKGVVSLAFSSDYKFLLSASNDHHVNVWSPYASHCMFKMKGHGAPLVQVQVMEGSPQIVTADTEGVVKIWDARNFHCVQSVRVAEPVTGVAVCGVTHRRVALCTTTRLECYDQEGGKYKQLEEIDTISCMAFNSHQMSIAAVSTNQIKVFNGLNGNLTKIFRGLSDSEITSICFDGGQRKVIVGDHRGAIRVFNYSTGAYMKSLQSHKDEVATLLYCTQEHTVISGGRDHTILIHDERPLEQKCVLFEFHFPTIIASRHLLRREELMSLSLTRHPEITTLHFSYACHLIAAADDIGRLAFWEMRRARLAHLFMDAPASPITCLHFVGTFPLVAIGDDSGRLTLLFTPPSPFRGKIAYQTRNLNSIPNAQGIDQHHISPATCLAYDEQGDLLFVGDSDGFVSVHDVGRLVDLLCIEHVDMTTHELETTHPAHIHIQGSRVINGEEETPSTIQVYRYRCGEHAVSALEYLSESKAFLAQFETGREAGCLRLFSSPGEKLGQVGKQDEAQNERYAIGGRDSSITTKPLWKLTFDIEKRQNQVTEYSHKLMQCVDQGIQGPIDEEYADLFPEDYDLKVTRNYILERPSEEQESERKKELTPKKAAPKYLLHKNQQRPTTAPLGRIASAPGLGLPRRRNKRVLVQVSKIISRPQTAVPVHQRPLLRSSSSFSDVAHTQNWRKNQHKKAFRLDQAILKTEEIVRRRDTIGTRPHPEPV